MIAKQKKEEGEAYIFTVLFDDHTEMLYDRVPVRELRYLISRPPQILVAV